jgi:hypothetical protein
MKSKALVVTTIRQAPRNRAQRCQLSGHSAALGIEIEYQARRVSAQRIITVAAGVILALMLEIPVPLAAQTQKGSWSDLNGLKSGQGVEVIDSRMKRHAGDFISVTDELLTLREGGSDVSIKRQDIARVSTSSGPKRGEHAVIGLLAGAAIGAGIGAASGSNHGFLGGSSRGIAALVGLAIGGPSGALVGAVIPAHTTVYRAPPGTSH